MADFTVNFGSIDELALAFCTELSVGGMFLETEEPAAAESLVQLHLRLPGTHINVPVLARVAHVRTVEEARGTGRGVDVRAAGARRPGMGLQFLNLTPETMAQLEAFIEERMAMGEDPDDEKEVPERGFDVLVVEDDPAYQRVGAAAFAGPRDHLRMANNGFEALAQCARGVPEIIVSDVNMPRMDGWQLLRLLQAKPQFAGIPVLFTTRLGNEADRLRGYQLGVRDYLAKPFKPAELRTRVERLVPQRTPAAPAIEPNRTPPPRSSGQVRCTLRGDLAEVSLQSMLSLFEMEQRTGRIALSAGPDAPEVGALLLRSGRPIAATLAGASLGPLDAAYRLLSLTDGDFEFQSCEVEEPDVMGVSATFLLMEHARLKDEGAL